ncbi:MAG TPA: hypothetical protein VLA48_02725 [Nitrososphaeraceae archaeon]|nr:hypothetical protein [Nitrososphaeraceae archaeon]
MFQFEVKGQQYFSNITVYTTNPDKPSVFKVIEGKATEKVHAIKLIHWASKEQDDLTVQFIEETLKDI